MSTKITLTGWKDSVQLEARLTSLGYRDPVVYGSAGETTVAVADSLSPAAVDTLRSQCSNFVPRRRRADLVALLQSLTAQQRNALTLRVVAEAVARDPGVLARAGIAVDPDEDVTTTPQVTPRVP